MRRKRFIKVLMSIGIQRTEAVVYANACSGSMAHLTMFGLLLVCPSIRKIVESSLPEILQGTSFTITIVK